MGYGTKYGDLGADIELIGDLLKEDVYKLAEHVGLPEEFIKKVPSAELYVGQTDETELGMSYKDIDIILRQIEKGVDKNSLIEKGMNKRHSARSYLYCCGGRYFSGSAVNASSNGVNRLNLARCLFSNIIKACGTRKV